MGNSHRKSIPLDFRRYNWRHPTRFAISVPYLLKELIPLEPSIPELLVLSLENTRLAGL